MKDQRSDSIREHCKSSVDGFAGAVFKGFESKAEATSFVASYALAVKQQKDAELAKDERPQEGQYESNRSVTPSTPSRRNSNVPLRNYARLGSYAESDQDDFVLDGTSPSRAYPIDDELDYS